MARTAGGKAATYSSTSAEARRVPMVRMVSRTGARAACTLRSCRVPAQHPHGAERVPATRLASPAFQVSVDRVGVRLIEQPAPVRSPFVRHQSGRLGNAFIGFDAGAAQVVEASQHVVVP